MNWLNRVPIWGWFAFTLLLTYAIWNPTWFSLWHFWTYSSAQTSIKLLVGLFILGILIMYVLETWRSLRQLGLVMFGSMIGVSLWVLWDLGLLTRDNVSSAQWWGQLPVAILLTVGFQGGRMYRSLTGRVPVSPDSQHADHHATPTDDAHHHSI